MSHDCAADRGSGRGNVLYTASDLGELVSKAPRRHRFAIVPTAGQRLPGLPDAECQQFLGLLALELAQFLNGEAWEGNGPRLLGLGRLEAQLCFGLLQALDHARSIFRQRSANISPRRIPVDRAMSTGQ